MTVENFRQHVLRLIQGWLLNPDVQVDVIAVEVLNALAGDIQVIDIRKD